MTPNPLADCFVDLMCNGARRAAGRARLLQRLDQQLLAVTHAADIEQVAHDAQKLIAIAELLVDLGALDSLRDPGQLQKVKRKLIDLKTAVAARTQIHESVWSKPMSNTDQQQDDDMKIDDRALTLEQVIQRICNGDPIHWLTVRIGAITCDIAVPGTAPTRADLRKD